MAAAKPAILAFNRGIVSKKALARVDLEKRIPFSAEVQKNWMPRSLGSMSLRPGLEYIGSTLDDNTAVHIPFIFAIDDTAIIELTDEMMRVRVDEDIISRVSVSTAITNGTFTSNVTGWTDADESGATSAWATGGYLALAGTGFNAAIRTQQVTVAGADQNKEHALRIVVTRGILRLRVGSSAGADDYITQTDLGVGTHSLAFTPTGNFHLHLSSAAQPSTLVDSITVEAAGDLELPAPWAEEDLHLIRWDPSADVIFVACQGYRQRKIERRGTRSWSIVEYLPKNGPFLLPNTGSIRLAVSALVGDITITSTAALFRTSHVGALFRITSIGQAVGSALAGDAQFSNPIRVVGVGGARSFNIHIDGTFTATVQLQRSVDEVGSWEDVSGQSWTAAVDTAYTDGQDNQIIYYRIGIKSGAYTSGTANVSLTYASGGLTGIARITNFSSSTSVTAAVLVPFGSTSASAEWSEGAWSDYRGFPGAVALFEGRLWWAGQDKIWGSVTDAFEDFDDETEGDSGPINRSIGSGPVDKINWLLPLIRLVVGGEMAERTARSSSLDEPLTPTQFSLKAPSTRGSSPLPAVIVDSNGIFARTTRLFELTNEGDIYFDYSSNELTVLAPEVGESGFKRLAVQRYPDTRIHCVRNDGTVAVLLFDKAEEVKCWVTVETDGDVEDAFILPAEENAEEDKVYYLVKRTINGSTKRFLERWALESECIGGDLNKQADSFVSYTGVATTTVTAAHLANEEVVVWGDGVDMGTLTLNGSGIGTLASSVENYVAGLVYDARYKSTKLAYGAQNGTALTQRKRVDHLGLILQNTHAQGIQYGSDFDTLDDLPLEHEGEIIDEDTIHEEFDADMMEFNGEWNTDSRLCLKATAPRPCTVLAAIMSLVTHEKP